MRKVVAFGSFDILHPGHLDYLNRAKRLGDFLIVVVARDSSIRAIKGRDPFFGEKERLLMVKSLRIVDRALLGNPMRKPEDGYRIIKELMPKAIVFGYDQRADVADVKAWLAKNRIKADVIKLRHGLNTNRYKSSRIRKAIA